VIVLLSLLVGVLCVSESTSNEVEEHPVPPGLADVALIAQNLPCCSCEASATAARNALFPTEVPLIGGFGGGGVAPPNSVRGLFAAAPRRAGSDPVTGVPGLCASQNAVYYLSMGVSKPPPANTAWFHFFLWQNYPCPEGGTCTMLYQSYGFKKEKYSFSLRDYLRRYDVARVAESTTYTFPREEGNPALPLSYSHTCAETARVFGVLTGDDLDLAKPEFRAWINNKKAVYRGLSGKNSMTHLTLAVLETKDRVNAPNAIAPVDRVGPDDLSDSSEDVDPEVEGGAIILETHSDVVHRLQSTSPRKPQKNSILHPSPQ